MLRGVAAVGTVGGLGAVGSRAVAVIEEPGEYRIENGETAVVVRADGVVLDGQGRSLPTDVDVGIRVTGDGVTVRNFDLTDWTMNTTVDATALEFVGTTGGAVRNSDLRGGARGILLDSVEGLAVRNVGLGRGGDGEALRAVDSHGCRILDCDSSRSDHGITLVRCEDFVIRGTDFDGTVGGSLDLVESNRNVVRENSFVAESGPGGTGDDNRVVDNLVCTHVGEEGDGGVRIRGTGNVVRDNRGCPDLDRSGTVDVVAASGSPAFEYRFVADGVTFGPEAESNDRRIDTGDGTTTVLGRVGNGFGDDYEVSGFREFSATTGRPNVTVRFDGEDVTDDVVGPERTVTVLSVGDRERFAYELSADGLVEKVRTGGRDDADGNDDLVVTEQGLLVRGVVGAGFGDTYRIWGGVTGFEADTTRENYELRVS